MQFNVDQINELIRRDYRVPRFVEITEPAKTPVEMMPEHLSMRDLLMPLLKDYQVSKKREAYLIEVVQYLVGHGCTFSYSHNPSKQKFINELAEALPDVKWPVWYKPDVIETQKCEE